MTHKIHAQHKTLHDQSPQGVCIKAHGVCIKAHGVCIKAHGWGLYQSTWGLVTMEDDLVNWVWGLG